MVKWLALLLLLLAAMPAGAQNAASTLKSVNKQIESKKQAESRLAEQAKTVEAELGAMRKNLVTLADRLRAAEEKLRKTDDELAAITRELAEREREHAARAGELEESLSAMLRFSRIPAEAWVALPGSVDDTVHSALLLGNVTEGLKRQSEQLRREVDELTRL